MRIGILTYHNAINYGAILQAYALQSYLKENIDADIEIINYNSLAVCQQYSYISLKKSKSAKAYILKNLTTFFRKRKRKLFIIFSDDELQKSKEINNIEDINTLLYDIVIVGSDQVWNPLCTNGDAAYLLKGVNETIRRISYAASIGNASNIDIYKKKYNIDYLQYLNNFTAISLRESDSLDFLNKKINKKLECVVDPVFLNWKNWGSFVRKSFEEYILVYNIGNFSTTVSIAKVIAKKTGIPLKVINKDIKGDILFLFSENYSNISPYDFVSYIANATLVITDSFHATAFSIMFHRKFYSIANSNSENTNSRLKSILSKYGLDKRYLSDGNVPEDIFSEIDYNKIDCNLTVDINFSCFWLEECIVLDQ